MTLQKFPYGSVLSLSDVDNALQSDVVAVRVMAKEMFPEVGELVGVRFNLNVLKSTGLAIQTLHKVKQQNSIAYKMNKGFYNGEACGYAQAVVLKNAYFNVNQSARESIAAGEKSKFAMASVDGEFRSIAVPENFEGLEIRFNPKNHHLFVDGDDRAVRSAEEVVVFGNRVFARGNIVYHDARTAPKRAGSAPSSTIIGAAVVSKIKP